MRVSGHQARGKALLLSGAFLFFCSIVALALGAAPAVAQSSKTSATSSTAKKSPSKPTRKRTPVRRRVRGQMAPQADRIREIQGALVKAGHYTGEPSGKWDASSVAALKSFQEANGLKATGKLNARTLQVLGLGSETAGIAPPRKVGAASDEGTSQ